MLEEQHRVVAADRGAQQAGGVHRVRREHDADARAVGEDALARLRVVRRAAAQVAADGHADDHRARPVVARAIAQHRHLVAQLHHRRPDVVEELDLDHRLQAARRPCPTARPMMLASASGELNTRSMPNARCSPCVTLKTPPLPGTSPARSRGCVRHVLAEHDDARVARHLVLQRAVDGRHHRLGLAFE